MSDAVLIERSGPVTTVLLSRPDRRNAVDGETARALAGPLSPLAGPSGPRADEVVASIRMFVRRAVGADSR